MEATRKPRGRFQESAEPARVYIGQNAESPQTRRHRQNKKMPKKGGSRKRKQPFIKMRLPLLLSDFALTNDNT